MSYEEYDVPDISDLLWRAQTALVKHSYATAIPLLEQAAALGSAEASLNLGNLACSHHTRGQNASSAEDRAADFLIAAQWYIRGIECELKKANNATPHVDLDLDLSVLAPICVALTSLYRRGKVNCAALDACASPGKGKHEDIWSCGGRVAFRLLEADPVSNPSSDFTQETYRRSIFTSCCYIRALVEYAPQGEASGNSEAKLRAVAWWQKIIDTAGNNPHGIRSTREVEILIEKAKQRVDLFHKTHRNRSAMPDRDDAFAYSTKHKPAWPADKPSPSAVFDIGSPILEQPHPPHLHPVAPNSDLHRLPSQLPQRAMEPSSTSEKSIQERRRAKRYSKFTIGTSGRLSHRASDELLSPTSEHSDSLSDESALGKLSDGLKTSHLPATTQPNRKKSPVRPHPLLRGTSFPVTAKKRPSDALLPAHASSASLYLSQELIGVPASSMRSRASSASMLSFADSMDGDFSRARVLSSASISSLPHTNPRGLSKSVNNGRGHSRKGSGLRNMLMFRSLSRTSEQAEDSDRMPLLQDQSLRPNFASKTSSEATDLLHTLLVNHHLAEEDLRQWHEEDESDYTGTENDIYSRQASETDDSGSVRRLHQRMTGPASSPPMLKVQRASIVPSPIPKSDGPLANGQLSKDSLSPTSPQMPRQLMSVVRKHRKGLKMDPVLAALEQSSAINTKAECSVCHVRGINFRTLFPIAHRYRRTLSCSETKPFACEQPRAGSADVYTAPENAG